MLDKLIAAISAILFVLGFSAADSNSPLWAFAALILALAGFYFVSRGED